jgi:hypothetical protein
MEKEQIENYIEKGDFSAAIALVRKKLKEKKANKSAKLMFNRLQTEFVEQPTGFSYVDFGKRLLAFVDSLTETSDKTEEIGKTPQKHTFFAVATIVLGVSLLFILLIAFFSSVDDKITEKEEGVFLFPKVTYKGEIDSSNKADFIVEICMEQGKECIESNTPEGQEVMKNTPKNLEYRFNPQKIGVYRRQGKKLVFKVYYRYLGFTSLHQYIDLPKPN